MVDIKPNFKGLLLFKGNNLNFYYLILNKINILNQMFFEINFL